MNLRTVLLLSSLVLVGSSVTAQTPAPEEPPPPRWQGQGGNAQEGFLGRLEQLLRDSRARKLRVVLRLHGEDVAGVVQDHGPGWVVLSNQDGQQILLQTRFVERAEIR